MHKNLLFKQLFDQTSGTYTYLLADKSTAEAVLIDTVYEQHKRDFALVQELALTLTACLETHCHADHVTGAWLLKHRTGCQILASAGSGIEPVEKALSEGDQILFGDFSLRVIPTPGHTDGCISLVMNDESMVFTGDALLIRSCGRTDFQQGSARKLYYSIKDQLFALPDDCLVYPAHDYAGRTVSSIGEEKQHNPRIGGQANEGDFVGYLENMQLPHPKQLDIAVPANLKAGRPDDNELPDTPDWPGNNEFQRYPRGRTGMGCGEPRARPCTGRKNTKRNGRRKFRYRRRPVYSHRRITESRRRSPE